MSNLKKFFTNTRILIYLVFFIITIVAISPNPWNSGVVVRTVAQNSSAYNAGMNSASPNSLPMNRERIVEINKQPVKNDVEYENIIKSLPANTTLIVKVETTKFLFINEQKSYFVKYTTPNKLGLSVYDAPKSNILLGLDLQGGTRVVLQPETPLSKEDMEALLSSMKQRLDVFGLTDTTIRSASDLAGSQFIIVEIAGANEEEVKNLLAKQGKFEAKIGNETVFKGGQDITYVCRSSGCSGLDPRRGCQQSGADFLCRFYFEINLNSDAAQRQADITNKLDVVYSGTDQSYLSQDLDLYLDDTFVDSLKIGSELKGKVETSIVISGSGTGKTRQDALSDMNQNMKRLQTILITGSLPVKLNIIKTDSLSPSLGREFLNNALLIGILSEIAVTAIVILRYKKIKVAIPIITVITSEILLILGVAAILRQNLDIAGIAGIIVAIGTGVDDQIVITDEILSNEKDEDKFSSWKDRIKKAFFIVVASYFATIAAMIPLLFAGAGLLKGFAITTIIGVTNGVFITRPAFAEMMKIVLGQE
jgi:preprotein translocase subunit SecD